MNKAFSPPANPHESTPRDVPVMSRACPCGQTLSRYNRHDHCHPCLHQQSENYVRRVRELRKTTGRQRILEFLSECGPHQAMQIAEGAIVHDNEAYRLLVDLRKKGQVAFDPAHRKWELTSSTTA